MRALCLLLAVAASACGGAQAAPEVPVTEPVVAAAPASPRTRLVLRVEERAGDPEAWVRGRLAAHGLEPSAVHALGSELVVEIEPGLADAAQQALDPTPEFIIAEVDEQWTLASAPLPAWARMDERTSWAGAPQLLRTVVAPPEMHDPLRRALAQLSPRPACTFFVGKNLLTVDQPAGAHGVLVQDEPMASGADIRDVEVAEEAPGLTVVYVTFDDQAAEALRRATSGRSGFRIALVLDGRVLMAPVITAPIEDGRARIDPGDGNAASARRLADELRRSSQPSPARLVRREEP